MADDYEDLDDLDEDLGEDEEIEGESGTFVDPGIEDEDVPEDEAVWELPDDTLPLSNPDEIDNAQGFQPDE